MKTSDTSDFYRAYRRPRKPSLVNEDASRKNFYILVDKEGKMPQLRDKLPSPTDSLSKSHPYYVQYVDNKPTRIKAYPGQKQVWDYSVNKYRPLNSFKNSQKFNQDQHTMNRNTEISKIDEDIVDSHVPIVDILEVVDQVLVDRDRGKLTIVLKSGTKMFCSVDKVVAKNGTVLHDEEEYDALDLE